MTNIPDGFTIGKPSTAPAGDRFNKADHEDRLLLFVAPDLAEGIETQFGTANAAEVAYIVVLDGPTAGTVWKEALLFGSALVPALTNDTGEIVAGRLVKGEAKPGKNAPWLIEAPTAQDEKLAQAWLDDSIATGVMKRKPNGSIVIDTDVAPF